MTVVYKVGDTYVDPNGNPVDAPQDAPEASQDAPQATQDANIGSDTSGAENTPPPRKRRIGE